MGWFRATRVVPGRSRVDPSGTPYLERRYTTVERVIESLRYSVVKGTRWNESQSKLRSRKVLFWTGTISDCWVPPESCRSCFRSGESWRPVSLVVGSRFGRRHYDGDNQGVGLYLEEEGCRKYHRKDRGNRDHGHEDQCRRGGTGVRWETKRTRRGPCGWRKPKGRLEKTRNPGNGSVRQDVPGPPRGGRNGVRRVSPRRARNRESRASGSDGFAILYPRPDPTRGHIPSEELCADTREGRGRSECDIENGTEHSHVNDANGHTYYGVT